MASDSEKGRLAEFFRTEYRKLLGFVRRRVDDMAAQDAEDFIHDVAVHLFDIDYRDGSKRTDIQ